MALVFIVVSFTEILNNKSPMYGLAVSAYRRVKCVLGGGKCAVTPQKRECRWILSDTHKDVMVKLN